MPSTVNLNFNKIPSVFSSLFPIYAIFGRSKKFFGINSIPKITAKLEGVFIQKKHLNKFCTICEITDTVKLPTIYPFTLFFSLFQRILSHKQAPLSMFQVLGKRIQIEQHRKIDINEKLDIHCEISGAKIVPKGLELYLSAIVKIAGETVWEAIETFFYRGNFGNIDPSYKPAEFNPIPHAKEISRWFLPEGIGFRFAKISGDGNGIHYSKRYARILGFKRDFAQPFLVLGNCINRLLPSENKDRILLDVLLKGQVYYQSNVIIKGTSEDSATRFDIYCEGNDKPCINGIISF